MKKTLKRNSTIDAIRECVRGCFDNGGHAYHVAIDRRDGNIALLSRWPRANLYIKIGEVNTKMPLTIKNVNGAASQVLKAVRAYNKTCLMSYSRAVSEYVKENVVDEAFVKTVDNPHYKCSAPMRLYDKNVIEYHLGN